MEKRVAPSTLASLPAEGAVAAIYTSSSALLPIRGGEGITNSKLHSHT